MYRADEGVRGDKKEVVKLPLKSVLYRPIDGEPRMPTSIMWNRLARKYDVFTLKSPLVVKEYLEGDDKKTSGTKTYEYSFDAFAIRGVPLRFWNTI